MNPSSLFTANNIDSKQASTPRSSLLAILLVGFVLVSFLLSAQSSWAADIVTSPASGSYTVGQTFTTAIRAVPGGEQVNAVEATLEFDPALLSVVNVSRDGSIFSLWTTEPTFSNTAGTVTFGGGSPTPFSNTSNVLSVTFRTVAEGEATLSFSDVSILAADGQGTDVFENAIGSDYSIAQASTPQPTPTPTPTPQAEPEPEAEDDGGAIIFGDPPRQPEVGSQTFLDQNVWYSATDGVFTWTLPFDVNAMAIEISNDPENVPQDNPDAIIDPPVEEFVVNSEIVTDGVQYLSINFQNQVGWGAVLNRRLMIDTTPPEEFEVRVQTGTTDSSFPTLTFAAVDETSGIEYYELTIADREPVRITPEEAQIGYLLSELEDGTYTARVIAVDMAGNEREGSAPVLIDAGWVPPVETEEEMTIWDYLTAVNILIGILLLIVLLLLIYIWYSHKVMHQREEKLRRETREIQDQMERIFSALRDEIYDQVNTITKRKRLSKGEREAVEGLTQALEVSETLIEKEITDVQSILK